MIEQVVSIIAAVMVIAAAAMRLNLLQAKRGQFNAWLGVEALGLVVLMSGCAGVIGEWFLPLEEIHAETIVLTGMAAAAVGISRGRLCQVVARLQGWDGRERRTRS